VSPQRRSFSLSPLMLLIIGFAILVAIGIASGMLVNQARTTSLWVTHTLAVERQIGELLLALRRAESNERGYLITEDPAYLTDYRASATKIIPELNSLQALVVDNPKQMDRLAQMRPLIERRLDDLRKAASLRQTNRVDEANQIVRRTESREYMDAIVRLAHEMTADEVGLYQARDQHAHKLYTLLFITTAVGGVLIVLLGGLAIVLVRRSTRELKSAQDSLLATNENLEAIVEARSRDLIDANEEIQRFAYIVSHDLRSPLVNIMGFTSELEALRNDIFQEMAELRRDRGEAGTEKPEEEDTEVELGSEFDEAIAFIKSSITKMDRLISAVLRLSREGRREFAPELIDMKALVQDLTSTVAHQMQEGDSEITVGDLPPLYSDRLAIEQVFSNLIDNALKYLKPGVPGEITINGQETPLHVVYQVSDNGRGIEEKDHKRVFELFRRSGQQDRPGEGIGLAHVQALVRRLGGQLQLESTLGGGSTFTIRLTKLWSPRRQGSEV
jgi:signal transduction histidine kinase